MNFEEGNMVSQCQKLCCSKGATYIDCLYTPAKASLDTLSVLDLIQGLADFVPKVPSFGEGCVYLALAG